VRPSPPAPEPSPVCDWQTNPSGYPPLTSPGHWRDNTGEACQHKAFTVNMNMFVLWGL
jgi:hypothetical protein